MVGIKSSDKAQHAAWLKPKLEADQIAWHSVCTLFIIISGSRNKHRRGFCMESWLSPVRSQPQPNTNHSNKSQAAKPLRKCRNVSFQRQQTPCVQHLLPSLQLHSASSSSSRLWMQQLVCNTAVSGYPQAIASCRVSPPRKSLPEPAMIYIHTQKRSVHTTCIGVPFAKKADPRKQT